MNIENKPEVTMQSKLIKKWIWLYIFAIVIMPLQYLIRLIVSNVLSPAEMGIIATVIGSVSIVAAYIDLWLREALNYYIPKYIHHNQKDKTTTLVVLSFIIQTGLGLFLACLLWRKADDIAIYYWKMDIWYIIKIFAVNLVVSNLFFWIDWLFLVVQDIILNKSLEFLRYVIYLWWVLYIYMIGSSDKLFDFSIYFVIWAWVSAIIAAIILWIKYKDNFFGGKFDINSIKYKQIQKYAFGILFMTNIAMLLSQVDIQFALKFVSAEWAWYYNNWLIIINGLVAVLSTIWWLVYPMISELDAKQDHHKTNLLTGILLKYIWVFSAICGIYIWFFGVYICVMLFGIEYKISWDMLKYIAFFAPFGTLVNIIYMILAWKGNIGNRVWSMIWWLCFMIISCFITTLWFENIGIDSMGINGIALSLGMTWLVLFVIWYRGIAKTGIEHSRDRVFISTNILTSLVYCWVVNNFYHIDLDWSRVYLLIQLSVIFAIYIILLGLVNYKTIKNALEVSWIMDRFIKNK